jgi:cell division protein FtsL
VSVLSGRSSFFVAIAVASAVVVALIHVWVHLEVIAAGYELARETRVRHDLAEQNQKLRLELETRKDPSVIERRAREELHMATPDPAAIRLLHRNTNGPLAAAAEKKGR